MKRVDFFFARIDLNVIDHPKAFMAGVDGFGLWAWSVCYCRKHLTDGDIPMAAVRAALNGPDNEGLTERLIDCGLWSKKDEKTIRVINYKAKNETRDQVVEKRKTQRNKKKNQRIVARLSPEDIEGTPQGTDPPCPSTCPPSCPPTAGISISEEESEENPLEAEAAALGIEVRELEYKLAYERGIVAGKGGRYVLSVEHIGWLNELLPAFARSDRSDRFGKRLRGDELLQWIAFEAEHFARWLAAKSEKDISVYSSFGPKGFRKYLNEAVSLEQRAS